jgi:hypothetical protein
MKFFTGCLAAGLVLLAGSAQAQVPGHYRAVSDVETPYVVGPRVVVPPPPYEAGPGYGHGPSLLPSTEVYAVLRDNGFSPLGIPRLRGYVYTITALDRDGAGGRLVIDARDGRILRFVPRRWGGDNFYEEQSMLRGPVPGPTVASPPPQAAIPQAQAQLPLAQSPQVHGTDPSAARPSRPAQVATRTVPMPKASPIAAKPAPAAPAPVQQAAAPAPAPKSAEAQPAAPVSVDAVAAKPAPAVAPTEETPKATEEMPKAQGLE